MKKKYEDIVKKLIEKYPERQKEFITGSSEEVQRLYTPEDTKEIDYDRDIGYPGLYPFTRGMQPTMYRGRLWTMRQYAGFGTAEESKQRYKFLLSQGQTGLSIAFDLCTQIGYDSDDPMSVGEVGKVGVAIDPLAGSCFVEKMTEKIEKNERIIVGVNKFTTKEESPKNLLRVDEKVEQLQVKKLHKIKAERDEKKVHENLEKIRKISRTEENLIPSILEAVKTYATLGEICNVLREEFGEYSEQNVF